MPQRYQSATSLFAGIALLCASTTVFASPQLKIFIENILQNSPVIQAVENELLAARFGKKAADQSVYNPELDFDAERTDINTFSIGLSQSIDLGDRRSALGNIANAEIKLKQAELDQSRLLLIEETLSALADLRTATQMQNLAQQRVELMQKLVADTEARQRAGDVGSQDVALAQVASGEAKMQLTNRRLRVSEHETRLQAVTGDLDNRWPELSHVPPVVGSSIDVEKHLNSLPSVLLSRAKLSAAKSYIDLSKAQRKPDPSIGFRAGMENDQSLLGISFSMPLTIRNSYRAELDVASQESLVVEQRLLHQFRQARITMIGAHQRYILVRNAWQAWEQNGLSNLDQQLSLVKSIWKNGAMSTGDYLVQAKQNVDAQEAAVELYGKVWQAWITWLSASAQLEHWLEQFKK